MIPSLCLKVVDVVTVVITLLNPESSTCSFIGSIFKTDGNLKSEGCEKAYDKLGKSTPELAELKDKKSSANLVAVSIEIRGVVFIVKICG